MSDKTKAVLNINAPDGQEFSEKGVIVSQSSALNGVCIEIYLPTKPIESVSALQDLIGQAEADKKDYPLVWWKGWEWSLPTANKWNAFEKENVVRNNGVHRRHPQADIIMRTELDKIDYPDFWLELSQCKATNGGNWTNRVSDDFYFDMCEYRQHPHRANIIEWHGCSEADKKRWQATWGKKTEWVDIDKARHETGDIPNWRTEDDTEYRLRPRICSVKVGDKTWEFPESVREPLEVEQEYWTIDMGGCGVSEVTWKGDETDLFWMSLGLVHLAKEGAEKHLSALQAVNAQVAL